MKRSAALTPLSHDHQHALDAALRLRRAERDTLAAALAHFERFFETEGRRHFAIAERLILPALPAQDAEWALGCARSSRSRPTVQFDTPKAPIRPASTSASSASDHAETGYETSSRWRMNTSIRSTSRSVLAASTSAATRSGRQNGGWQPFA